MTALSRAVLLGPFASVLQTASSDPTVNSIAVRSTSSVRRITHPTVMRRFAPRFDLFCLPEVYTEDERAPSLRALP